MHIVQICQRLYHGRGQEMHVYNLSNELAKRGHRVEIYTSDLDIAENFKKNLVLHSNLKIIISKGVILKFPTNQIIFPNLADEIIEASKKEKIDLIHAHGAMCYSSLVGITVAKTISTPFVFTPHFHPWRFFEQRPYRYMREIYEKVYTVPIIKESSATIAVSPFEKDYLVTRRKVQKKRIKIIPNGINVFYYPSIVSRRETRKRLRIPEDKKYIITFGSISDPRKGIDRSLQIFEKVHKDVPNSHLIICGWKYRKNKDLLSNEFDKLTSKKDISTLGYISEGDKVALLKMSDVLISPTSYEAFGIVLGEALSVETPVVVTKIGGTPYIVRHRKTGLSVGKFNSINRFVKYTKELLLNENLRKKYGANGKKIVKKYFSWKKIGRQVENLYLKVQYR